MSFFFSSGNFDVIPDSGVDMFSSPIIQFWAPDVDADDGTSPIDFPEILENDDATDQNGATFHDSFDGIPSIQYDGNDYHTFSPTASWPSGDSEFSIAALVYPTGDATHLTISWGNYGSTGEVVGFGVDDQSNVFTGIYGVGNFDHFSSVVSNAYGNEWFTIGMKYDGNTLYTYANDTSVSTTDPGENLNIQDQDHTLGSYAGASGSDWEGYIAEIVVSDVAENDSTFSDYYNSRLG